MLKTLQILNGLLVTFELFLCTGKFFGFPVVFGHGLGDLLYWMVLYGITFLHLVVTWKGRRARVGRLVVTILLFSLSTLLFSLKATLLRGPEYSWDNRHLFYSHQEDDSTTVVIE